jgi:hypothetical protein
MLSVLPMRPKARVLELISVMPNYYVLINQQLECAFIGPAYSQRSAVAQYSRTTFRRKTVGGGWRRVLQSPLITSIE